MSPSGQANEDHTSHITTFVSIRLNEKGEVEIDARDSTPVLNCCQLDNLPQN